MLEAERRLAEAIEELARMIAKSGELLVDIQGGTSAEASAGGDLGAGPPGSPPGAVRVEPAARAGGDADAGLGDGSRGGTGKPHTVAGFDPRPCLDQLPVFSRDRRGRTKTHGMWIDEHGVAHDLLSGEHDGMHVQVNKRAVRLGRIPPGAKMFSGSDIELKFAMGMRQTWERTGTIRNEIIVINKPEGPCQGELGCDALLPYYLPPGGTLTVYWPGGNHRTYRGAVDQ
ncbi:MAG: hypothetical protein HKP61_19440 [Dactylosporangium sp.]|nr:hypothetical protein [Dactylosporangium sp.]NNJ63064.1 hypothetical protein [Dactylosporangium sp.]